MTRCTRGLAFDPELVRRRAALLDGLACDQRAALPLLGMPVAIKDIFDTAEEPTEYGSPIYAGHQSGSRRSRRLAAARGRRADRGEGDDRRSSRSTRRRPRLNPLDPSRTPGGSSSGSGGRRRRRHRAARDRHSDGWFDQPARRLTAAFSATSLRSGWSIAPGSKQTCESLDTVGLLGRELEDLRLACGGAWGQVAGLGRLATARATAAVGVRANRALARGRAGGCGGD